MTAIPAAELDLHDTAELVAVPETPYDAYIAEHRAGELWLRSLEMQDPEFFDEPTRAG